MLLSDAAPTGECLQVEVTKVLRDAWPEQQACLMEFITLAVQRLKLARGPDRFSGSEFVLEKTPLRNSWGLVEDGIHGHRLRGDVVADLLCDL